MAAKPDDLSPPIADFRRSSRLIAKAPHVIVKSRLPRVPYGRRLSFVLQGVLHEVLVSANPVTIELYYSKSLLASCGVCETNFRGGRSMEAPGLTAGLVSLSLALSSGAGYRAASTRSRYVSASTAAAKGLPTAGQSVTVDQDLTPLMLAARDQESGEVKQLLKQNPDLNFKDNEGWTALAYAALNGNSSIAKALIQKGADVNLPDTHGTTPLMHAVN